MKVQNLHPFRFLLALALHLTLNLRLYTAFAQDTAFSYQGHLNEGANPASGVFEMQFTLFDKQSGGTIVAGPLTNSPITISNGLFATTVDFGTGVFDGDNRWLEIGVRTNGSVGPFVTLSPRQQITSTPYAIQSANSAAAVVAESANAVAAANISGTIALAQLPGELVTNNATTVNLAGTFKGNGAGVTNVNARSLSGWDALFQEWLQTNLLSQEARSFALTPSTNYAYNKVDQAQGVAVDHTNVYVSLNTRIEAQPLTNSEKTTWVQTSVFGGYSNLLDHIGDITVYHGKIYAAACSFVSTIPCISSNGAIAVYDARDGTMLSMNFVTNYMHDVAAVTVDPDNQLIWAVPFCESGILYTFHLDDLSFAGAVAESSAIGEAQGIGYHDGKLYINSGLDVPVTYVCDTNGNVELPPMLFSPTGTSEAEGIDVDNSGLWMIASQTNLVMRFDWLTNRTFLNNGPIRCDGEGSQISNIMAGLGYDPIDDGLQLWFSFDDDQKTSSVVYDRSPNKFNGVSNGALAQAQGIFGGAFYTDGGTRGVKVPNSSVLSRSTNIDGNFTVACWIKATNTFSSKEVVASCHQYGSNGEWLLQFTATDKLQSRVISPAGGIENLTATLPGSFNDGKWHLLVFRVQNDVELLWWDTTGVAGVGIAPGMNQRLDLPIYVGGYDQDNSQFKGWIDEFKIWTRGLQANEVRALYNRAGL